MSKTRENFYLPSKELRATTNADGSRSITGLIAYNKESSGLPWTETIAPGAFTDALKADADVLLLRDHKQESLLARTLSKTLVLEDTPIGLKFTANLSSNNSVALDTIDSIERKDLTGVSFGFSANKDEWSEDGTGVMRTLLSVHLYEISVTSFAAFPDSSVSLSLRSVPEEYRSLLSGYADENNDDEDDEWAKRSRMRVALEQARTYAAYISGHSN